MALLNRRYGVRVRSGVSVSAPQRVTVDYFEALSEMSKELDVPFDIHILETKLQRVHGQVDDGLHHADRDQPERQRVGGRNWL